MRRTKVPILRSSFLMLAAAMVAIISVPQVSRAQSDKASDQTKPAIIRIKAGVEKPFKDSKGNVWLADAMTKDGGFEGGDTIERPDLKIEKTDEPGIYRAERYSMDSFSWKLPNGKYIVKLHFAETYDGIGGVGDRVFTFNVQGKDFKNFDIWKKSGGIQTAYVESVPVEIKDGKLKITFTPIEQNPAINGIEIIPIDLATDADKKAAGLSANEMPSSPDKPSGDKASSTDKPLSTGQSAQSTDANVPVKLTRHEDHERLMALLGITSIRPGKNGSNVNAPNYANYDESTANPYPDLPDPLTLKNGDKVTTEAVWWHQRRPEIVEDFDREIYGRVPAHTPKVNWEVKSTNDDGTMKIKQLVGHVDNSSCPAISVDIQLTLATPSKATGPVPVMVQLMFAGFGNRGRAGPAPGSNATAATPGTNAVAANASAGGPAGAANGKMPNTAVIGSAWKQNVIDKGWGWATLVPTSVQPDNGEGLTQGIIGLCNNGQPRKLDDWGALRAWAWGVSRAIDYFETDKDVDAKQVGLEGHSRYGKATLLAMAYEPRLAICYVSSSGEGGAKIHRRNWGEIVENVAGEGEYHWMAGNFIKYAGPLGWNDLPVDSHELVALCAPRPVFIGGGVTQGDGWADTRGCFMAAVGAGPVYKLLGKKDLGATEYPPIETALIDGDLGFRQHSAGHTDFPNWPTFIKFADRYIKSPPLTSTASSTAP